MSFKVSKLKVPNSPQTDFANFTLSPKKNWRFISIYMRGFLTKNSASTTDSVNILNFENDSVQWPTLGGSLVTTAGLALRLRAEKAPCRYGGLLEYTE
jgi:hypothetical protein